MASGNQQPSFKTNVNRMKTKRWVEAKSYTYDGDDWGDADEYDEYDGYDDPAPAPAPAAASSRQPSAGYPQDPRQQAAPFPGAPPQPAYMQQQQQPRSGSPGRPPYAQDPRDRSGSFDRGDERRNFSGPPAPGSPTIAPLRTAYGSAPRNQSPMGRGQPRTPASPQYGQTALGGGRPGMEPPMRGPPGQLPPPGAPFASGDNSGRTWSMGSRGSQGSHGSIALAQRRDYPSGPAQGQQPQAQTRPPRKSSLGQNSAPSPALMQQMARPSASLDTQTDREPAGVVSGPESPTAKIIRPADIYKRVAEEKERERMSQESGRPSMSEIVREKENKPAAPASGHEGVSTALRPRKHTLDTVAERKSEYGLDGVLHQSSQPPGQVPQSVIANMTEEQYKRFSTSPQLPEFGSGFGDDDWLSGFGSDQAKKAAAAQQDAHFGPVGREADIAHDGAGLGLSHKPSDGLRSVVHQAFDEPVHTNTPGGSEVGRSDTTSTNAISPIVSRNSSKEQDAKAKAGELRAVNMGAIAEEGNIGAPHEGGADRIPGQIDGKAQPSDDLPPPGFIPGHRRDTSIPSPGNSPARQPKLEVRNVPQDEEGAEFAAATPNEERESRRRAASAAKASQIQSVVETLAQQARDRPISQTSPTRADSPTKGRVRDLVGKAESASSSRRGSESSQTGGLRPSQDRADSFRPQLPGGWNSYVTNPMSPSPDRGMSPQPGAGSSPSVGASAEIHPSSLPGAAVNPTLLGHGGTSPTADSTSPNMAKEGMDIEPTTRKRSLVQGEATDPIDLTRDPLAAAKAAGAALAGAVTAVTGLEDGNRKELTYDQYGAARGQHAYEKGGMTMYPDSTRPMMPPSQDSTATSIMPTPRGLSPKRTSETPSEDDIPAVAPLRQRVAASPVPGIQGPASGAFSSGQQLPSLGGASRDASLDEHDRHMQDIVRQLTPNPPSSEQAASQPTTPTPSSQIYTTPGQLPTQQPPTSSGSALQPPRQAKPKKTLKHKFSWEADSGDDEEEEEEPAPVPARQQAPPTQTYPTNSATAGPIVAPTQTITTVKSEPIREVDSMPSAFQHGFMNPATPAARVEEPAILELPALRTSSDAEDSRQISELSITTSPKTDRPSVDEDQFKSPPPPAVPLKNDVSPMSPSDDSRSVEHQQFQPPSQGARQRGQTLTGSQVQVPAFREILAMKSPDERLRVYRNTQETFANMNTGLTNWIQTMGDKHPEHRPLLQTAGNFSAPTPGLPAAPRPQPGASTSTGTSSGFSGLRKAGAVAAPSMGDAGAALKSAGRDTKKLAKGLFAKGRSKFGRDKGSSKLAPFSSPPQKYQPYRPGGPSPQNQAQYAAYRPGQQASQPVVQAAPTRLPQDPAVGAIPAPDPAPGPALNAVRHTANQKSLPAIPAESPAASVGPRSSDVSGFTHSSVDEDRMGEILIALPPMPESPPPPETKPALRQRLTIHQKDIQPFEVSFPSELLDSDAYKAQTAEDDEIPPVPSIADLVKPGTPKEEEAIPDQPTPRQTKFPKRAQSLSAGRTLDPGIEVFNTTPSWLNWDPTKSPANSDLFNLSSPSSKSTKSSPMDVRSKRASLQIPLQSPENKRTPADQPIQEEDEATDGLMAADGKEDRPFSFINFGDRPDEDFSLNEVAYRAPSRQSSVITESTGDYNPSVPSIREDSLDHQISRDDEIDMPDQKPLPDLPQPPAGAAGMQFGAGQYATMPPRTGAKVSLFPQPTSRPGTREREPDNVHGDFAPRVHGRPPEQSATMPVGTGKPQKHRRNFSGANLLQRALTAGINTLENAPKRDKNVVKAEKTDKKRRRFSNLNILGKPKPAKRVPIDETTPPGTPRAKAPIGGVGDLATIAQPANHFPKQALQRPNIPDPIHVAPIEGYYSPEGDATQSPALLTSPIPSTHIASQLNDGTVRTIARTSTSPAGPFQHSPSLGQKHRQDLPPRVDSHNHASAFNESNNVLRQALYAQQHGSPIRTSPHPPPPSNPPSTQLPQVPHLAHTLQREATLRQVPESPQRPIDPGQLNPHDGYGGASSSAFVANDLPLDRRSLDAFPRPPSKSSNASASGLSPNSRSPNSGPQHSPSPSVSAVRRSRGPSLSVDTNLANSVSEGRRSRASQASRPSNVGHSAGTTDNAVPGNSQKSSNNPSASNLALAGNSHSAVIPSDSTAKPTAVPHSQDIQHQDQDQVHSDDELPSGLSALHHSFSQQTPSNLPTSSQHQQPRALGLGLSMSASAAESASPPHPTDSAQTDHTLESATVAATGTARKVPILPGTLRQMRQREIELGGETRLNSPMAAGAGVSGGVEIVPMPRLDVAAVEEREEAKETEMGREKVKGKGKDEEEKQAVGGTSGHGGLTGHLTVQRTDTGLGLGGKEAEGEKEKGKGGKEAKDADGGGEEEKIVMSATSFPGQEWNPYEEWM